MELQGTIVVTSDKKVCDGMMSTIFVLGQSDKEVGNEETFVICVTFEMDYKGETGIKGAFLLLVKVSKRFAMDLLVFCLLPVKTTKRFWMERQLLFFVVVKCW